MKDYTYRNLNLMQEKDVVVMKGDKDLSVVILNKTNNTEKLENMVKEGIDKGTSLKTLRTSNNFLNEISKDMISLMICYQHLTNQPEYICFH